MVLLMNHFVIVKDMEYVYINPFLQLGYLRTALALFGLTKIINVLVLNEINILYQNNYKDQSWDRC